MPASITTPSDSRAIAQGFHYVLYGPDLKIPYAAANITTRRATIAKRPQVLKEFMEAMAEAAKVLHTNKEFSYKVLAKYLGIGDTKILDAAYGAEIKVLERRLEIRPEGLQAILDDVVKTEPRALANASAMPWTPSRSVVSSRATFTRTRTTPAS